MGLLRIDRDYRCCEKQMLPATRTNSCWRMDTSTSWRCGMTLRSEWVHAINISYVCMWYLWYL
jgi:hypothetical protein